MMTTEKENKIDTPHEFAVGRVLTDAEIAKYETWKGSHFGELDEYFTMMMRDASVDEEEIQVYEFAVRAFINDIACEGLPTIGRAIYNRELDSYLAIYGLQEKAREMAKKDRKSCP